MAIGSETPTAPDNEGETDKSPPSFRLRTLKKRRQFQAANGGRRHSSPAFTLLRGPENRAGKETGNGAGSPVAERADDGESGLRFGFTITRKVGTATERNRIRRRLKEAVRAAAVDFPAENVELVILARRAVIDRAFADLVEDIRKSVRSVLRDRGAGAEKRMKSED